MTETSNYYSCNQCHRQLKEAEKECSVCGSTIRDINVQIAEEVKISESLEMKKFTQGIKDFVTHLKQGWFPSNDKEKHPEGVDLVQSIDRENNFYKKKVTDKKTGNVVKDLEEPLSDHH